MQVVQLAAVQAAVVLGESIVEVRLQRCEHTTTHDSAHAPSSSPTASGITCRVDTLVAELQVLGYANTGVDTTQRRW